MEKPYRYEKKLIIIGHSVGIIVPQTWIKSQAERMKIKKVVNVILEIYKDKIIILPKK